MEGTPPSYPLWPPQPSGVPLWPPPLSHHAAQVDWLVFAFTLMLIFLVVPIFGSALYFILKYRHGRPVDRSHQINRSVWIEVTWTGIPFLVAMVFFVWGARLYYDLYHPPANALEINVVARQWMWKFEHPGGQREIDELHIPVGTPVKMTMISQDVIHDLYFPALRVKQDVLPDRYTTEWFQAERAGEYLIECAEFCGTDHSRMGGRVVVMEPAAYQRWLEREGTDMSLAAQGEALFRRFGCSGCHGANSVARAPSLVGVYGSVVPLADSTTVIADERYLRDSILLPQKQVVAGYAPIMPSFANRISEEDLLKLVAYLKSIGAPAEARVTETRR